MSDEIMTLKEVAEYLKLKEKPLTGMLLKVFCQGSKLVAHGDSERWTSIRGSKKTRIPHNDEKK